MNIGLDVDGVLIDLEGYQMRWGMEYFVQGQKKKVENPKAYDIQDIFGCTKEERDAFWTRYIWKYCLTEPMTVNVAETVRKLRKRGHKIYIITGRVHTTKRGLKGWLFRNMLKYWLRKNRLIYDEILFCSEDGSAVEKVQICKEKHIDIMVDDKPENLLALKDNVGTVCYPAAWNEDCRELDAYRIGKFEELIARVEHKAV